MGFVILWVVMGFIVAMIARGKGRSAPLWFIYGALVWPIALVHALLIKADTGTIAPAPAVRPTPPGHPLSAERLCPHCAETVKHDAKICRFCQRDLPPLPLVMPIILP